MREMSHAEARNNAPLLRSLLKRSLKVIHDLETKTDVYLGVNEARDKAGKFAAEVRTLLSPPKRR